MQLRQLQGLIAECKAFQEHNDSILILRQKQQSQASLLRGIIRQTRLQIIDLQYKLKAKTKQRRIDLKDDKNLYQVQKQIVNTLAINAKIKQQHQQLLKMGTNLRKKIDHIDNKIIDCLKQLQLVEKYQQQTKMGQMLDDVYWELRSQLQSILIQGREEKDSFEMLQKLKQEELQIKKAEVQQIDQKYVQIDQQVRIQRELINTIINQQKPELNQSEVSLKQPVSEVKIMDQNQAKYFYKTEDLNMLEKAQLQIIFQKQEFKKIQQASKIGKILHQHNKTNFFGRIVRHQRIRTNTSDISHLKHPKSETSQITYSQHNDLYRSQRMQQLEKRKRVRTRQTQISRFLQKYKNRLNDDLSSSSIQIHEHQNDKPKNILEVYEQLKKQSAVKHRTVGNIEIIKLIKKHKKRKVGTGGKGISLECQDYSLL